VKLLVDSHLLLWAAGSPERLPAKARSLFEDPDHALLFSAASVWEIAIKRGLGRSDFQVDPRLLRRGLLDNGYGELPVTSEHAVMLDALPPIREGRSGQVHPGLASPRRVRRMSGRGFDESSTHVLDSRAGHPWPAEPLQ
jgi:PIN domain nuclease of toxin-antitoxin system